MRSGNLTPTVVSINSDGNVGFNNSAPEQAVDVKGNIKISPKTGEAETGVLQITSTINSTSIGTGSIITTGGIGLHLMRILAATLMLAAYYKQVILLLM